MTGRSAVLDLVAAAIGFDVIGGAVCNATDTTKEWYHQRGQRWQSHIGFLLPHLLYVALIAALLRGSGFDLRYAAWLGGCIVVSAAAVLFAPLRLKRPVAFAAYLAAVSISFVAAGPTLGLEWFSPALFLKLLIGHLVPDRTMDSLP